MSYKLSIIIPVYNASSYIVNRTLKSIENQTMDFEDIEVILVNDCSTDDTAEKIKQYKEKHDNIKLIDLIWNNGGPAIPRNIGITYAEADYLMFLDQDDTFKENACEILYNKITNENVDLVCGNHNLVTDGRSKPCFDYEWAEKDEIKISDISENPDFLRMGVAAWSKIFKKDLIIENDIKFTEGVGEDIYFSIRSLLLAKGIILLKNFIVVDYNIQTNSLSHQIDADYMEEFIYFYLNFFDYCETYVDDELYQPLFTGRMNQLLSSLFYSNLYFNELSFIFINLQKLFQHLNKKLFYFENGDYQLFFDTINNDSSPFEHSILTYSLIKSKRENKFDNAFKYLKQKSKLYVDCGNGFNENDIVSIEFYPSEVINLNFDISNFKNIKRIRFDPVAWFFIKCKIISIKDNNNNPIGFKANNAANPKSDVHSFFTVDSQYLLTGKFNNVSSISISFNLDFINNNDINRHINVLQGNGV